MAWIYLVIAGLFEVGFTTCLKLSNNFTHFWATVAFILLAGLSFFSLSLSLKEIPIGTAYAIWTGIGAFGTAILGILFFGESVDFWRIFFLILLITSIIGLKLAYTA